jgi:hypothetical protein
LREARVTIYDVDPLGAEDAGSLHAFYYENFLKGAVSAGKVDNGNRSLQVLAFQSGGRVLNRSNDLADLIATSVADARAYYTLTFSPAAADHPDEYHDLQVKISKPGLTARGPATTLKKLRRQSRGRDFNCSRKLAYQFFWRIRSRMSSL